MNYKQIWAKARPYVISFVVLIIFIELIWGLTAGALIGASLGTDKDTQEEIGRLLKEKGIERPSPSTMSDDWYEKLPPDVKEDMSIIVKRKLRVINWFVVTISVSALVFASGARSQGRRCPGARG